MVYYILLCVSVHFVFFLLSSINFRSCFLCFVSATLWNIKWLFYVDVLFLVYNHAIYILTLTSGITWASGVFGDEGPDLNLIISVYAART